MVIESRSALGDSAVRDGLADETIERTAIRDTGTEPAAFLSRTDDAGNISNIGEAVSAKGESTHSSGAAAFPTTDLANAHRLARAYNSRLRWVLGIGWLVWTDRRWEPSDTRALRLVSKLGRLIQREAARLAQESSLVKDDEERDAKSKVAQALLKWARQSEAATRIRAAMDLAQPLLEISVDELDSDPWALNCSNGTVDLRTGELRCHSRFDFLTRISPVAFDPDARSELWEGVLDRAIPDPESRRFLQRAAGYTACGVTGEDVVLLIQGPTRSAKGTVQGAIAAALGGYGETAGLEDLAERTHKGGPRPELVRLRGARMVSTYETQRRLRLDAALLKTLSGSDPFTVRDLHKAPVTFVPQFTPWIATNHRPELPHDDDAVWERIRELAFNVQIPSAERDPSVRKTLSDPKQGGPAVLRWIVEGALAWQREGLRPPQRVREATADYRMEMDPLRAFLEDCCALSPESWTKSSELRETYEAWCRETGEKALTGSTFAEGLARHGCKPERRHSGRGWRGIDLPGVIRFGEGA